MSVMSVMETRRHEERSRSLECSIGEAKGVQSHCPQGSCVLLIL